MSDADLKYTALVDRLARGLWRGSAANLRSDLYPTGREMSSLARDVDRRRAEIEGASCQRLRESNVAQ
jgi:hypothetical protein